MYDSYAIFAKFLETGKRIDRFSREITIDPENKHKDCANPESLLIQSFLYIKALLHITETIVVQFTGQSDFPFLYQAVELH